MMMPRAEEAFPAAGLEVEALLLGTGTDMMDVERTSTVMTGVRGGGMMIGMGEISIETGIETGIEGEKTTGEIGGIEPKRWFLEDTCFAGISVELLDITFQSIYCESASGMQESKAVIRCHQTRNTHYSNR